MERTIRFQRLFEQAKKQDLIHQEDTSIVFYDLALLSQNLKQLKALFPENCKHTVAIKTNPLRKVLNAIGYEGIGHEAASAGEVHLAAEHSNEWIVYDGPAKTAHELEQMIPFKDRLLINANSFHDLNKIRNHSFENIGLRINTNVFTGVAERYDVSAAHSKFGIPVSQRDKIVQAYVDHPQLNGLHFHLGSGMTTVSPFREALQLVRNLLKEIKEARAKGGIEHKIKYLDIGGGLLAEDDAGQYERWEDLGQLLSTEFEDLSTHYTLITEFGQYIHTHTSWLYTEIADVLDYNSPETLILHQGANMFVRQAYTDQPAPFTYYNLNQPDTKQNSLYDLAGPLCFSGDYIARGISLPQVSPGDSLAIDSIGANTYALWSKHCSFPFPKVIGYKDEEFTILKEREGWDEIADQW